MSSQPLSPKWWLRIPLFNAHLRERARDACRDHDVQALKVCLDEGLDPDVFVKSRPSLKPMPLVVFAADLVFVEGLELLLSRGAAPDARVTGRNGKLLEDVEGHTALFRLFSLDASSLQQPRVLACASALVRAGADVGAPCWVIDAKRLQDMSADPESMAYGWFSVRQQQAAFASSPKSKAWERVIQLADARARAQVLDQGLPPVAPAPAAPKPRF